ncbi:hypothetical protein H9P43_005679 [Blastocladiella emersonii ATCC 22665]|nr:hypothetical protein H9P43_005679 [Blastocladiella emersonii ATCC 22665]
MNHSEAHGSTVPLTAALDAGDEAPPPGTGTAGLGVESEWSDRPTAHTLYTLATHRSAWAQFLALCRKNLLVKARDSMPWIIMLGILVVLNASTGSKALPPAVNNFPLLTEGTCVGVTPRDDCVHLAYTNSTPVGPILRQLVPLVAASEPNPATIRGFPSRAAILDYFLAHPGAIVAAVEFKNVSAAVSFPYANADAVTALPKVPAGVEYTVYTNYSSFAASFVTTRFLTAQTYVERAIINTVRAQYALPPLAAPFANGTTSSGGGSPRFTFINTLQQRSSSITSLFPFYFVFMLAGMWANVLRAVASEKKARIKSTLAVQGLGSTVYLAAMSTTYFVTDLPTVVGITAISVLGRLFASTDPILLFVALALFLATCTLLGLVLSVLVEDPKKAESTSQLAMYAALVLYAVGLILVFSPAGASPAFGLTSPVEVLLYLVSPVAFARLISILTAREVMTIPTNWASMMDTQVPLLLAFIAVDAVIYAALAWYLDKVFPGSYGQGLPAGFPFNREYWDPELAARNATAAAAAASSASTRSATTTRGGAPPPAVIRDPGLDADHVAPADLAVSLRGLIKTFKRTVESTNDGATPDAAAAKKAKEKKGNPTTFTAVNQLSLDVPRGTVLGLAAKNGSGKSVTLSMLTGLLRPDSGSIAVLGIPMTDATLPAIQQQIGLCPQDDILWPHLTCLEHLRIFAAIRGVRITAGPSTDTDAYLLQLLQDLYLKSRAHDRVATLSGGMKRKLTLAIALLGAPPLLVCDEMSDMVDTYARTHIWRVIHEMRAFSTIIMTSHSLEEVDALSDTVAVMAKGEMCVVGSPLFFKRKFGSGYRFSAERAPGDAGRAFDPDRILAVIQAAFPGATIQEASPALATFTLPSAAGGEGGEDAAMAKFTEFFHGWDALNAQHGLGVAAVGLGMSTLEDIFLQLNEKWEAAAPR